MTSKGSCNSGGAHRKYTAGSFIEMATNCEIPADDIEMAESEGDVVTMVDVLKEQQDFEANANAVLGGSDDKECTYSKVLTSILCTKTSHDTYHNMVIP